MGDGGGGWGWGWGWGIGGEGGGTEDAEVSNPSTLNLELICECVSREKNYQNITL